MREIRKSGSMSGERKRSDAERPKLPRLSSTLLAMPLDGSRPSHRKPTRASKAAARPWTHILTLLLTDWRPAFDFGSI
jgi:hypothetical protein